MSIASAEVTELLNPRDPESAPSSEALALRCLWIARELPFPTNTGDRIYTARLAKSLGDAGADVTFVGLEAALADLPGDWPITWHPVAGIKKSYARAILSTAPLVMAAHDTKAFARELDQLFEQPWDAVVIDHYGCGFALERMSQYRQTHPDVVVVHIAQNHEERLAYSLFKSANAGIIKRAYLFQNFLKTRRIERRLVREVDLVSAITDEDQGTLGLHAKGGEFVVLTPGYDRLAVAARRISLATPRHVLLIGSYRWVVKHENLRMLLCAADRRFAEHGIVLDVIGDVPEEIRSEFSASLEATCFHGFVEDPATLINGARLALVPEVIGGGFKLKFLDYIFSRLPVVAISAAAAGLPVEVRTELLLAPDIDSLITCVIDHIDQVELLQQLQERAFAAARSQFDWLDRGIKLRDEVIRLRDSPRSRQTL